ncbi:oligopeptide transport system permease protein AppB [Microlunatus endophyticus]|uniref:Oligopeptide transport system permease protein AppB n=1 Tax=Microlunatus endophyticus TaxID=1716077 RepID=A0A917SE02_9ACTN|nr:ABC transporter permease [Microlunatus endophyticus]GGL75390.1 oligopeptide transport system permease protein AppB [Microlunatus endophyticus]
MIPYIIRRILIGIPVLWGVTVINFVIINLAPGSPADLYLTPTSTPNQVAMMRHQLGLDQPIWVRYVKWLGQLVHGDLGYSLQNRIPVTQLLGERILPTLTLMGASLVVAYAVAIPFGIFVARRRNTAADYGVVGLSFLGISVPHFFLGLVMIYVFAVKLGWFPTGNIMTLGGPGGLVDRVEHLVLPTLVLATAISANMVRYVRSSMIDVLGADYIRTARAKGLGDIMITNKHALRNALTPIVTVIGVDLSVLLGGAIVTEQIFQWQGIGLLTIQAIQGRDYSVLMGINLIAALGVFVANLLTDIAYGVVDPRVKYS